MGSGDGQSSPDLLRGSGVLLWPGKSGSSARLLSPLSPVPAEDGRFEGEIGDEGGEIGAGAVGTWRREDQGFAGLGKGAVEGVARGDNDRIHHERVGDRAEEFGGGLFWAGVGGRGGGAVERDLT
ncbi:hypothetical protein AAC387_Pa02g0546 [Persea americana]